MRTVVHDGQEYHLTDDQDWVAYIATDANGSVYGYSEEPEFYSGDDYWDSKGANIYLGKVDCSLPMTKL